VAGKPQSIHWNFMQRGGFWYRRGLAFQVSIRSLMPGIFAESRAVRRGKEFSRDGAHYDGR
jgi:hypothetical protein